MATNESYASNPSESAASAHSSGGSRQAHGAPRGDRVWDPPHRCRIHSVIESWNGRESILGHSRRRDREVSVETFRADGVVSSHEDVVERAGMSAILDAHLSLESPR